MNTNKRLKLLIPLIAIGTVIAVGYEGFGWKENVQGAFSYFREFEANAVRVEAWQVMAQYREYALEHDLDGIERLSAKLSPACQDKTRLEECYALMDNVYAIMSQLQFGDFKNVLWDDNKITLYTDWQGELKRAIYFVQGQDGAPKISGMRFCILEDASKPDDCSSL